MTVDQELVLQFCDGTPLDEEQFEYLLNRELITQVDHIGYYAYELTNKGKELLYANTAFR